MAVITTGAHPALFWPGVHKLFGMEYNKHPKKYSRIFDEVQSDKAYEEDVVTTGFGLAQLKPEGQSIGYDDHSQEGVQRYRHDTWALGYIVTQEERDDNLYLKRSNKRAAALARSMAITKEINGANILNRGFDGSNYADGWDGKELFATDHPTQGGSGSNELNPAADLSEAALEDLCIQISQMDDTRGLQIALTPRCLIIPPALMFEAERILKSTLQNDTANNAINALRSTNMFPDGVIVNHYLTDPDAFFIKTDVPTGLQLFTRKALAFTQDNDFDSENAKAKAVERYKFGWSDWRSAFASAGA